MKSRYDLIVIGGGTAGLVSAAGAAALGARVALVELDKLGGDCLYYGCVPTKTLVKSARVAALVRRADEFGVRTAGVEVDFPAVVARMRHAIHVAGERDDPDRFRSLGVDLYLEQEASFNSPEEIVVDGGRLSTRSVIVATGSHSVAPPITGLEEASGEERAFVLCTFWLISALILAGREREAEELLERMLERATPLGLFAEEIEPATGAHLGNLPQAFSHIGVINAAVSLAQMGQRGGRYGPSTPTRPAS